MTKDEALKLALEALKQIDEAMPFPVAKLAQAAIKEALAQPEPEYLAFMDTPHRTWVGLTDGEVDKMILLMGFPPDWITENAIVKNIVRNLEAKLKEKNT